VFAVEFLS